MAMQFGSDPGIQTVNPNQTDIMAKARLYDCCCLAGAAPRMYFYVNENSVEYNTPRTFFCIPPNFCCPGQDVITKTYFDRGPWDTQSFLHVIGCVRGPGIFFANHPKHVCCCMDCHPWYNACVSNYWPCCCGDRLIYTPYESCCWGLCSAKANCCNNCFGICGPKDGEPLCFFPLYSCMEPGTAEDVVISINKSRTAWNGRSGKP